MARSAPSPPSSDAPSSSPPAAGSSAASSPPVLSVTGKSLSNLVEPFGWSGVLGGPLWPSGPSPLAQAARSRRRAGARDVKGDERRMSSAQARAAPSRAARYVFVLIGYIARQ